MCIILFAVATVAAGTTTTCSSPSSDNACATAADDITGIAQPNCVNVGTYTTPVWECRQCAVNCDCQPGEYCIRAPGPTAGTCTLLSGTGKIGASCTSFGLVGTPGARVPVKDVDDRAVCGSPLFDDGASGDFIGYEWLGYCSMGKCTACVGDTLAWEIATAARNVPGMSLAATSNGSAWDGGSLVCGGRYCYYGNVVAAPSWFYGVVYPAGAISGILAFVILIFVTDVIATGAHWCARCCRRRKRSEDGRKQRIEELRRHAEQEMEDLEIPVPPNIQKNAIAFISPLHGQ
jgi:hypothetical protein